MNASGFLFLACSLIAVWAGDPEMILTRGRIATVDSTFSISEAVAIADGKILRVGSNEEVLPLRGAVTEVVDLQGKFVVPGLIDSHTHPADACMTEFDHPLPEMESIPEVLDYIRTRAKSVPASDWITVRQVFITRLREQRYPTRAELDEAAPNHPVLFATGPDASLNTRALKESGIDREFKVADGESGFAEKDATGEPTGILRNCTRYVKVRSHTGTPTLKERTERLTALFADYNAVGLTSICERDASSEDLAVYQEWRRGGPANLRVHLSRHVDSIGDLEGIRTRVRAIAADPLFRDHDEWLRVIGIKTYLDGGMLTGSAYMRQPWGASKIYAIDDPAYCGVRFIPPERLVAMVRATVESGLQFTAHSVGDGAVQALLEAYEQVSREMPIRATHPCISHSNFMSRESIEAAARLGVMLDIQPAWLYLDTRTLATQFGYDRMRWFQPLRSVFEAGAIAGGGSDHMQKIGSLRSINPYNPFLGMATAVTRKAKNYDGRLHPEESLSREQALRFYTINNAQILRRETEIGSLEPGKRADFAVLDTDLLTCPEEKMAATQVLRTYVSGKLVYSK